VVVDLEVVEAEVAEVVLPVEAVVLLEVDAEVINPE